MPRYSHPITDKFRPFRSVHQHGYFLTQLSADQWSAFQEVAAKHSDDRVHPQAFHDIATNDRKSILHALHAEHQARKKGEHVGGGIWDGIVSVGSCFWDTAKDLGKQALDFYTNPVSYAEQVGDAIKKGWHVAQNIASSFGSDKTSDHSSMVASALQESYVLDETERVDYIGDLVRDQSLSTKYLDVWVDEHRHPPYALVTCRGSKTAEDFLVDDVMIGLTGRSRDLIQDDLTKAVNKYADQGFEVEAAGHSLGTTLLAVAMQHNPAIEQKISRVDFYNPATSPLLQNAVSEFGQDEKFYWNMNLSDMIGWGNFDESPPKNLVMLGPKLNPLKAHGLEQWVKEEPEKGQLDDDQQKNLNDPNAGWHVIWGPMEETKEP